METLALPTSGTYTFSWGILKTGMYPLTQTVDENQQGTVTYLPDNQLSIDGTIYDYKAGLMVFGSKTVDILVIALQGSNAVNGGFMVLADPSIDLSKYTFVFQSVPLPQYITVTDENGVQTLFRTWDGGWDGKCFLAGTLIATPNGSVAVENIKPGDLVYKMTPDGEMVPAKVAGVGTGSVKNTILKGKYSYPVRIKTGSIAENIPNIDLLLTSEHCLFIDGKFIPARMLVNGSSIVYDRSYISYDYYHIRMEEHSILVSNGLTTESYLETGDYLFDRYEGAVMPSHESWEKAGAAPLCTDAESVRALYSKVSGENRVNGLKKGEIRHDDIKIVDKSGREFKARQSGNNIYSFHVSSPDQDLYLSSSAFCPAEMIGPYFDDRRLLGALVGKIEVFAPSDSYSYEDHLTEEALLGWHRKEKDQTRWTNGMAELPKINRGSNSEIVISIEIFDQFNDSKVEGISLPGLQTT